MEPQGLVYREEFITADEERARCWRAVTMRGQTAKCTVLPLPADVRL